VKGVPKNVKLYIFILQHIVSDECKIDVVFSLFYKKRNKFLIFVGHTYILHRQDNLD